jgi:acyl-CoA reductase-like NAD-dependent aldehyde dehydrogenase
LTAEAGSTYMLNETAQFASALDCADYAMELARRLEPRPAPVHVAANLLDPRAPPQIGGGVTVYEPIGVVACIMPYNFPFFLSVMKVYPVLHVAAGRGGG